MVRSFNADVANFTRGSHGGLGIQIDLSNIKISEISEDFL